MDPDITLVTGLFLVVLAFPSIISSLFELRFPLIGVMVFGLGAAAVWYAFDLREGGYTLEEIPHVIYRMVAALRDALFA